MENIRENAEIKYIFMNYTVPDSLLLMYIQLLALGTGPVVNAHLELGEQGVEGGQGDAAFHGVRAGGDHHGEYQGVYTA